MHGDAGRVRGGRRARVVPRVRRLCLGDEQPAGARLFLRDHADAAAARVVDHVPVPVPVDEAGRIRRLQHHARQVYVAAAPDVHLGVADDLGLGYCADKQADVIEKRYDVKFIFKNRRVVSRYTHI